MDRAIIDKDTFDKLEPLYKERNKVVHRYSITDFKTRDLYQIVYDFELVTETVRVALQTIENKQYADGIGVYGSSDPQQHPTSRDLQVLYSRINDKHLIKKRNRAIKE